MNASEWRLSFGANLIEPDRTQFRIWAPAQRSCLVAIEGHVAATHGRERRWLVHRRGRVRSRHSLSLHPGRRHRPCPILRRGRKSSDVHSASVVVDPASYRWQQAGLARPAMAGSRHLRTACRNVSAALRVSRANCRGLPNSASPPSNLCRSRNFPAAAIGVTTACCRLRPSTATARPTT